MPKIDTYVFVRLGSENDRREIEDLCRSCVREGFTFLLFIADSAQVHAAIKYAEIPDAIPTEQVKLREGYLEEHHSED